MPSEGGLTTVHFRLLAELCSRLPVPVVLFACNPATNTIRFYAMMTWLHCAGKTMKMDGEDDRFASPRLVRSVCAIPFLLLVLFLHVNGQPRISLHHAGTFLATRL